MKHINLIIISLSLFANFCAAQTNLPLDTLLSDDNSICFFINNGKYQMVRKNLEYRFIKNDTIVLNKSIPSFIIHTFQYKSKSNSLTICASSSTDKVINIDFSNDKLEFRKSSKEITLFSHYKNNVYYKGRYNKDFFIENLDLSEVKSLDLNKMLTTESLTIFELIKINDNGFLINMGSENGDEFYNEGYYLFQETDLTYTEYLPESELLNVFNKYGMHVDYYSLNNDYVFLRGAILDSNYKYFSGSLALSYHVNGLVIYENKVQTILIRTSLDTPYKYGSYPSVLIQYNACPHKEKAMYEIYNNQLLLQEELEKFDVFELRLLRNMVFAKYNYAFNDEFLTAYFNLYDFYLYGQGKRTKDVNGKLTNADKANLELIKSME